MLHHSVDFAERHRFLGRASEAQIESFHASFNALFHKQHRNQAGNKVGMEDAALDPRSGLATTKPRGR